MGFKPPTKDMNVTIALALMSIILIEVSGIRQKGTKGWLKSFAEPMPIILPINILEIFIRPLSLCMRLFGNVLGSFVVMELLKLVVPAVLPAFCSMYFDMLTDKLSKNGYEPKELRKAVWSGTEAMMKNDGSITNEKAFWRDFEKHFGKIPIETRQAFEEFYRNDFNKISTICPPNPAAKEIINVY